MTRSFVKLSKFATLATNVVVMPGVTIGEGALALVGSIVTKDLDDWGIYIGSPVKRIGERNAEKVKQLVARLEEGHG